MSQYLDRNRTHQGRAEELLTHVEEGSVALSVWSPPYHVGKEYERGVSYSDWLSMLAEVIAHHGRVLRPAGFMAINIADILCFRDPSMPKIMAENVSRKKCPVTREDIEAVWREHPSWTRYQIAAHLGCSEQTVQRRTQGNNVRGGKYETQTRVKLVGGLLEQMALDAGLYLYDRRVWVKDAAWENSRWHTVSYRAVDEFEYVYFFWKPGPTRYVRDRLSPDEWKAWGSRAVWQIPSVRANDDHEAKFPLELPRRVIRLLTDPHDLVLDCFMGSGTTAVAATLEKRDFIGIELLPAYVQMAERAHQAALKQALAESIGSPALTLLSDSSPEEKAHSG